MTYTITGDCIGCAACEPECGAGAIFRSGETYCVDPAECNDCGTCAEVCPVEACVLSRTGGEGRGGRTGWPAGPSKEQGI